MLKHRKGEKMKIDEEVKDSLRNPLKSLFFWTSVSGFAMGSWTALFLNCADAAPHDGLSGLDLVVGLTAPGAFLAGLFTFASMHEVDRRGYSPLVYNGTLAVFAFIGWQIASR